MATDILATVCLHGDHNKHGAHRVWQFLFEEYNNVGGDLDRMSDILWDLRHIEQILEARKPARVFWDCTGHMTYMGPHFFNLTCERCLEIDYKPEEDVVVIYRRKLSELLKSN